MNSPWVLLLLAIAAEVIGTSYLNLSQGFTQPVPTLVVLSAYSISMTLISREVQVLPRASPIPSGVVPGLWRLS